MKTKKTFWLSFVSIFMLLIPSICSATPVLDVSATPGYDVTVNAGSNPYSGLSLSAVIRSAVQGPGYQSLPPLTIMLSDQFSGTYLWGSFISSIVGEQPYLATIEYQTYWGNSLFDLSNPIFDTGLWGDSGINFMSESNSNPGGTFYLTEVVRLTHRMQEDPIPVTTSINAQLGNAVPEPSSLILLGSGLVGAALFSRRKK